MERIESKKTLQTAVSALLVIEPKFAAIIERHGMPDVRLSPATLETLLLMVTEQFLSLKAAEAIWTRVKNLLGEISASSVLSADMDALFACGLSRAKVKCFKACASAQVDFSKKDVNLLRKDLLAIWGIGPWTADVFLLSACGHADAWPVGDVALQAAAQDLLGLSSRPNAKVLTQISLPWRPHRKAAALLLWAHYRGLKAMEQASSQKA